MSRVSCLPQKYPSRIPTETGSIVVGERGSRSSKEESTKLIPSHTEILGQSSARRLFLLVIGIVCWLYALLLKAEQFQMAV